MSSSTAVYVNQPKSWTSVRARQVVSGMAPMLLLYLLYTVVRFMVKDRGPVDGIKNSYHVLNLEKRWGFDWEVGIQNFMLPHEVLVKIANWYYVLGFLPVILASAAIAALLNYRSFLWWRRRFALTMLLAMVGFALYPLAPPRMLPGMVDTLMVYGPQYYGDTHGSSLFNGFGRLPSTVNVYAAMPSMHVAWSIIAGALVISAFRGRRLAWVLGAAHPFLMGVAVIVTANHYLLDVVLGVIALVGSLVIVQALSMLRAQAFPARHARG